MPFLSSLFFIFFCLFTLASLKFAISQLEIKRISHSALMPLNVVYTPHLSTNPQLVKPTKGMVFYIELALGTPPLPTKVAFDTTTPMTWVQTPQCHECFPIRPTRGASSMYNPSNSTSFRAVQSKDPICGGSLATPSGNFCNYDLGYTRGLLARDRLGLAAVTSSPPSAFVFGCGLYNRILIGGTRTDNPISGMLGLATGHQTSIMSQFQSLTMGRFSYCLPAHYRGVNNITGSPTLDFGRRAILRGNGVQTTPFLKGPDNLIYLNVTHISLDGQIVLNLLKLARARAPGSNMFLLDSISPSTLMMEQAYNVLSQAVAKYFGVRYGWVPFNQSLTGYDLCYPLVDGDFIYPKITLHMQAGAKFDLLRLFQKFPQMGELCMTIIPINVKFDGSNVLGTPQQETYRIMCDFSVSRVSFAPNRC